MATRVTREEMRKLARDLMPEILSELETGLFNLQERQVATEESEVTSREEMKVLIREVLLELIWELEPRLPDPDEGLELRPEVAEQLRTASEQPTVSLDDLKRELGLSDSRINEPHRPR